MKSIKYYFLRFILSNKKLYIFLLIIYSLLGIIFIHKFFFAGILLYISIFFLLCMSLYFSQQLWDRADFSIEKKQKILMIITLLLFLNLAYYFIEVIQTEKIIWKSQQHSCGEYSSAGNADNKGWFSGNVEGGILFLETRTGAIGFGFSRNKSDDPVMFNKNINDDFNIKYSLSHPLVVGVLFEGKDDVDLTRIKTMVLLPGNNVDLSIPLKSLVWVKTIEPVKHLKLNYIYAPLHDRLVIELCEFIHVEEFISKHYLGAI